MEKQILLKSKCLNLLITSTLALGLCSLTIPSLIDVYATETETQTPPTEGDGNMDTGTGTDTPDAGNNTGGDTGTDTGTGGNQPVDSSTGDGGTGSTDPESGTNPTEPGKDKTPTTPAPLPPTTTVVPTTVQPVTTTVQPVTTTVAPKQNTPVNYQPYYPPVTQPSTNPNTIQTVQPTQVKDDKPEDDESMIDLIQGDYVCFNANIFKTEKEADEFIKLVEKDEAAKGNIRTMKEVIKKDFVLVRVFYEDNADHKKKWILFYVATQFKEQKEAEKYIEENLMIYPDVFFKGQVIKTDDKFNVVFGIRSTVNTQALTYKEDTLKIEYLYPRQEYKYKVKLNKETMKFEDPIPEAVEKAFPGKFTFTSQALTPDEEEVTMTPVKDSENQVTEETTTTGQ